MQSKIILSLLVVGLLQQARGFEYLTTPPVNLSACRLTDLNLATCLGSAFQNIFSTWKDGIAGLTSVASIEPSYVNKLYMEQHMGETADFTMSFNNVVVWGLSNSQVSVTEFNPLNFGIQIVVKMPEIHTIGDYTMKGRMHSMNIDTTGTADGILRDIEYVMNANIIPKAVDGEFFFDFDGLTSEIRSIGGYRPDFSNLFNGDKELEAMTSKQLNDNWREAFEMVRPAVVQLFEEVIFNRLSTVFKFVPLKFFISDFPVQTVPVLSADQLKSSRILHLDFLNNNKLLGVEVLGHNLIDINLFNKHKEQMQNDEIDAKDISVAVNPCKLEDDGFGICFASALENIFTTWKDGIPGVSSIGSIDPIFVDELGMATHMGATNFGASFHNLLVRGLSKAQVSISEINPVTFSMKIVVKLPEVIVDGDYAMKGQMFQFYFDTNGKAHEVFDDVEYVIKAKLIAKEIDGEFFLDFDGFNAEIANIGKFSCELSNLFNGDRYQEYMANKQFNDNWREAFEHFRPSVEQLFDKAIINRFRTVFYSIPLTTFVPDFPLTDDIEVPSVAIKSCNFNDGDLGTCFGSALQNIFTTWKDGIPGVDTIPPLEPSYMNALEMSQHMGEIGDLSVEFSDAVIWGLSKSQIVDTEINPLNLGIKIVIKMDNLFAEGYYKTKGRMHSIYINSNGRAKGIFDGVEYVINAKLVPRNIDGEYFFELEDLASNITDISKYSLTLTNLFPGDKEREEMLQKQINENWREMFEMVQPAAQELFDDVIIKRIETIFRAIPLKDFVPDFPLINFDFVKVPPKELTPCSLNSGNLKSCFGSTLQNIFTVWKDGISGVNSIGSIDPGHVNKIEVVKNVPGIADFTANFHDIVIRGFSTAQVTVSEFNPSNLGIEILIKIPKMSSDTYYTLKGKIHSTDFDSSGTVHADYGDVEYVVKATIVPKSVNGEFFFDFDGVTSDITNIDSLSCEFKNLFHGDKYREYMFNKQLNDNWRETFDEYKPAIKQAFDDILLHQLRELFVHIPLRDFIPDFPLTNFGFLKERPKELTTCHFNDGNLSSCFASALQNIFTTWKNGISGVISIGSIDPMHVPQCEDIQHLGDIADFTASFQNGVVQGMSNTQVSVSEINPSTFTMKLTFKLPRVIVDTDYTMKGKIRSMNVDSSGQAHGQFDNMEYVVNARIIPKEIDGEFFFDIDRFTSEVTDIGKFSCEFKNLFHGDRYLEYSANKQFNDNWRETFEEMRPAVEKMLDNAIMKRIGIVFHSIPLVDFVSDFPLTVEEYIKTPPVGIKTCDLYSENMGTCFSSALQNIFTTWKDGIPGANTILPLEPSFVDELDITQHLGEISDLKVTISNVLMWGLSKAQVISTEINPLNFGIKLVIRIPHIYAEGDYKMKGRIRSINLDSSGRAEATLDNIEYVIKAKLRPKNIKGEYFFEFDSATTDINVFDNYHVSLDNLFPNDKNLEEMLLKNMNENWRETFENLRPGILEYFDDVIMRRFRKVFHTIPLKFFVPNFPLKTPEYLRDPPAELKPCSFTDLNLGKCLISTIQNIFSTWSNGISGLSAITSLEPTYIDKLELSQHISDVADLEASFSNVVVKGFSRVKVTDVQIKPLSLGIKIVLRLPEIIGDADYKMKGTFHSMKIDTSGTVHGELDNLEYTISAHLLPNILNGESFFNFAGLTGEFTDLGKGSAAFTNLFHGDKVLEDMANKYINEHWRETFEIFNPSIVETLNGIIFSRLLMVFQGIPLKFLISDFPLTKLVNEILLNNPLININTLSDLLNDILLDNPLLSIDNLADVLAKNPITNIILKPVADILLKNPITNILLDNPVTDVITNTIIDNPVTGVITNTVLDNPVTNIITNNPITNTVLDNPVTGVITNTVLDNPVTGVITNTVLDNPVTNIITNNSITNTVLDNPVTNVITNTVLDNPVTGVVTNTVLDNPVTGVITNNAITNTILNDSPVSDVLHNNPITSVITGNTATGSVTGTSSTNSNIVTTTTNTVVGNNLLSGLIGTVANTANTLTGGLLRPVTGLLTGNGLTGGLLSGNTATKTETVTTTVHKKKPLGGLFSFL